MKKDEFNPFMKFHGLFVPNGIAMSNIPNMSKLLLGKLLQYSGKDGKAYPTRQTLTIDLCTSLSTIDKNIRTLKNLKLIRTYTLDPNDSQAQNLYAFLLNPMYETPLVKNNSRSPVKNNSRSPVKNDKDNRINNNRIIKKVLSKDKIDPAGSSLLSKRKLTKIVKVTKSSLDPKERSIVPKGKKLRTTLTNSSLGERMYTQLVNAGIGITKHKLDSQARINSIESLHRLFSPQHKNPFHSIVQDEYKKYEWDLDTLIEVFEYHMKHSSKKIKVISDFIFASGGFNGGLAWSPLVAWHRKMNKTDDELTEQGEKLFKSLKHAKIDGIVNIETRSINNLARDILEVSSKYVFVENEKEHTDNYRVGIISLAAKYIKELTNNRQYELVWINKKRFIVDEVIPMALKRNILKRKHNGRSIHI